MAAIKALPGVLKALVLRGFVLESAAWTWALIVAAFSRASSYWFRPPMDAAENSATARIEGALSYPMWTLVILISATLMILGTVRRNNAVAWLGHLLGIGIAGTLAFSIFGAAVFDGAAWSGFGPLVVVLLVHFGRANALGPAVADRTIKKRSRGQARTTDGG